MIRDTEPAFDVVPGIWPAIDRHLRRRAARRAFLAELLARPATSSLGPGVRLENGIASIGTPRVLLGADSASGAGQGESVMLASC